MHFAVEFSAGSGPELKWSLLCAGPTLAHLWSMQGRYV